MLDARHWHVSITAARVSDLLWEANIDLVSPGVCLLCGTDHDDIEPDAVNQRCDHCQADQVTGMDIIAVSMA